MMPRLRSPPNYRPLLYSVGIRASLPSKARFLKRNPTPVPASRAYTDHTSLDRSSPRIEEELVRNYKAEHYYPANIGDVLQSRYKIVGKLGYGSASTVWLCRDISQSEEFVALKIYINSSKFHRELPVYQHLQTLQTGHSGQDHVRKLIDHFSLSGPHGEHTCLVHEALGMNMDELKDLVPEPGFEPDLIRQTLRDVLRALYFLHHEAGVIHTDVQPKNILLGVLDNTAFLRFERDELEHPFPRKKYNDHTVYVSHPMPLTKGAPLLSDFSEARFGHNENRDLIMPDVYRAPEVILGLPWSYSVDVWAFCMTLWDLFQPTRLFDPRDDDGRYCEATHLAQMIALMGPPPLHLLQSAPKQSLYWDAAGNWMGKSSIPNISLDSLESRLQGEEQASFLCFIRRMLQWRAEDRDDIRGIISDDWFADDLIRTGQVERD